MTNLGIVWVLSFTVLGIVPEHGSIAKYSDKQSCEEALKIKKQEARAEKKQLAGACNLRLTTAQK